MSLEIRVADSFYDNIKEQLLSGNTKVPEDIIRFIQRKSDNWMRAASNSDGFFAGKIHDAMPSLRKSHLSGNDRSIVYKIEGSPSNRILYLYGVFTHDDLGTGHKAGNRLGASMGERFKNMTQFDPFNPEKMAQAVADPTATTSATSASKKRPTTATSSDNKINAGRQAIIDQLDQLGVTDYRRQANLSKDRLNQLAALKNSGKKLFDNQKKEIEKHIQIIELIKKIFPDIIRDVFKS